MRQAKNIDQPFKGIALLIAGLFTFVTINLALRFLEQTYSPVEILFFRYVFGMGPAIALIHYLYGWTSIKTKRLPIHAIRGVVGAISIGSLFQSILLLPYADAVTLTFCSSLFLVALASLFLKEKIGWKGWACVFGGFCGVLIVAQPTGHIISPLGIGLGLLSAFIEAALMVHNRLFARSENGGTILMYQTIFSGLACAVFVPFVWVAPTYNDLLMFLILGVGGSCGQFLIIISYRYAPARLLAPLIYTPIILSVSYGYLFFSEKLTIALFLGSAIIIASGLIVMYIEKLARPT